MDVEEEEEEEKKDVEEEKEEIKEKVFNLNVFPSHYKCCLRPH